MSTPLRLRLPATSANLGPGFDTLALALALYLELEATPAAAFSIKAEGRSPEICRALQRNLLLATYTGTWEKYAAGRPTPLALSVRNGIPIGMGCGSSAASRLAGIALASHFAGLGWSPASMLDEAAALEHHPDNAAACCLGGFVVSGYDRAGAVPSVQARSIEPPAWHALLVLPTQPLSTTVSRAILPARYDVATVVENLQNLALLVAAFTQADASLLRHATGDRLHQPFRSQACPLLPRLLPLAGSHGILSVTLSGAGPAILLLLASQDAIPQACKQVLSAADHPELGPLPIAELLTCALERDRAVLLPQAAAPANPGAISS